METPNDNEDMSILDLCLSIKTLGEQMQEDAIAAQKEVAAWDEFFARSRNEVQEGGAL